ncbi:hypothetical protein QWA68_001212 [Fusarium oxysporum]|nr:hypothetical protein QWA68_001212 [Fusarium oxysporum]
MPLPGRGIPGPWSHINVTSMQQLSVIGFKLISSVRTLNTIAYQAEAPSILRIRSFADCLSGPKNEMNYSSCIDGWLRMLLRR